MLLSAPTPHDMKEWINALRLHQIDVIESRATFFERKLQRAGVRVPRASILITQGFNAPLQSVKMPRTQSAQPGELQSLMAPGKESKSAVSTVTVSAAIDTSGNPGLRRTTMAPLEHQSTLMVVNEDEEEAKE